MLCRVGSTIGKVGEASYPMSVDIVSRYPIPIGTYIVIPFKVPTIESAWCCAVGVISLTSYKRMLPISPTATSSESIGIEDDMLRYSPSVARIIALVCSDNRGGIDIRTPNVPPPPDSDVYLASAEILSTLFSCRKESSIKIGHLLTRPEVDIYVDLNALTRHLFIAGTTGSGKSNTVAILADRIASYGGAVVIFDVHGEYTTLEVGEGIRKISIDYKINPLEIPPKVFARMIIPEGGATVQRMLTAKALSEAQKLFKELKKNHGLTEKALEVISKELQRMSSNLEHFKEAFAPIDEEGSTDIDTKLNYLFKEVVKLGILKSVKPNSPYRSPAIKACDKVDEFFENAALSFEIPHIDTLIGPSTLTILNVSLLSDEQKDHVLKVMLDELLWLAKHNYFIGRPLPIIVFIEEAHLFLSTTKTTTSKYSIERVAREGRKFGLSLGIISQRPRNIDMNTLSQIQNFVFMKLVQEADQQAVMNASDMLTEDLAKSLASMGTGEALILGDWIGRFPVFTKIDKHEGKRIGATLDIASIWRSHKRSIAIDMKERIAMVSEAGKEFEELFS